MCHFTYLFFSFRFKLATRNGVAHVTRAAAGLCCMACGGAAGAGGLGVERVLPLTEAVASDRSQ